MEATKSASESQAAVKYWSVKDLSEMTGLSRSGVLRHITPHVTRYRFGPQTIRYRSDEVLEFIASRGSAA